MPDPVIAPTLFYRDPIAALRFLESAFGFEIAVLLTDGEGRLAHSELRFNGAVLHVSREWEGPIVGPARMRSPASLEGVNTQFLRVHLQEGLDAHCASARAAGARIVAEPQDQFYGDRVYRALDLEGHVWNFAQTVGAYDAETAERDLGFKTVGSLSEVSGG